MQLELLHMQLSKLKLLQMRLNTINLLLEIIMRKLLQIKLNSNMLIQLVDTCLLKDQTHIIKAINSNLLLSMAINSLEQANTPTNIQ
jgi:hypothetical protein